MIEAQNINFSYGKNEILKNISLKFEKGKLYAVIGPNGCGKTTLIKLLSRINSCKGGKLSIDGQEYQYVKRKKFSQKVAFLPQGRNVPNMTVYDLVSCGRFPYLTLTRRLSTEDEKNINSALMATNTKDFAEKSLKKLSGGERQRVYIAMLLAQTSSYLLLDEPTTYLDISAKFDVMNLLCDIKNNGKCVIAVIHDIDLALKYADEIILMKDGSIVSKTIPSKIVQNGIIESVFGIKCGSIDIDGQTIYHFDTL